LESWLHSYSKFKLGCVWRAGWSALRSIAMLRWLYYAAVYKL
jgi:hypothetical protein